MKFDVPLKSIKGSHRRQAEVVRELLKKEYITAMYKDFGGLSVFAHYILTGDKRSTHPLTPTEWHSLQGDAEVYLSGIHTTLYNLTYIGAF